MAAHLTQGPRAKIAHGGTAPHMTFRNKLVSFHPQLWTE